MELGQDAQPVQCKPSGIKAVRRVGRLMDEMAIGSKPIATTFEEIEFSRAVAIPPELLGRAWPRYYRAGRDAVRVGVSLPTWRKRINFSAMGHFFYPLMAPSSETGSAISVSAPFELDADRSALLSNDWNAWLTKQAADSSQDALDRRLDLAFSTRSLPCLKLRQFNGAFRQIP